MKFRVLICIFAFTAVFFTQCASTDVADSKDVSQSKIYQSYSVSYDDENQDYYAEALYRFGGSGGTTLTLSEPSRILLNGTTMTGNNFALRGYVYNSRLEKNIYSLKFEFINTEGKSYINNIIIDPIIRVIIPDSFSKTNQLEVSWEGNPIRPKEKFTIRINGNGSTFLSEDCSVTGAKSFTIPAEKLATLGLGTANFQIIRNYSSVLMQGTELGGNINLSFFSKKAIVKVLP